MMKLARLALMLFLVAGWAAAQCGGQAMATDDKGKKDSATAEHKAMSCCCCKHMGKHDADSKDASQAGDKDAAKSQAKSGGGMMAGGMACCAKMGKDAAGGIKCGGGSQSKSEAMPEQKMK